MTRSFIRLDNTVRASLNNDCMTNRHDERQWDDNDDAMTETDRDITRDDSDITRDDSDMTRDDKDITETDRDEIVITRDDRDEIVITKCYKSYN